MSCTCGCCAGVAAGTPIAVHNRPGLSRIETRIGTHGSVLATMLARLSSKDLPELTGLTARDPADPAIALLDAWATVADAITFYQERIANEGYLRTATERRSLVELARLVGYAPRPGVAASVHLAFALDKEPAETLIPKGTKANSIPGPGETMEAFETGEDLVARPEWSAMKPRKSRPQNLAKLGKRGGIWVMGTDTRLKPGDSLVLRSKAKDFDPRVVRIEAVEVDHDNDRTRLGIGNKALNSVRAVTAAPPPDWIETLATPPTVAPASAARLGRSLAASFGEGADTLPRLVEVLRPALAARLHPALGKLPPVPNDEIEVFAMRIEARAFGHNAPLRLTDHGDLQNPPQFDEWEIAHPWGGDRASADRHLPKTIFLDNDYPIAPDSLIAISQPGAAPIVIDDVEPIASRSLNAYGLSGKTVQITWDSEEPESKRFWFENDKAPFSVVRNARVLAGSERLALADAPIDDPVAGDAIELDELYAGLESGRWLIVEGERADVVTADGPVRGLRAAELVMLAGVTQRVGRRIMADGTRERLPGDTLHTALKLAGTAIVNDPDDTADQAKPGAKSTKAKPGLAYTYYRDSVTIHGNVAKATHGETRDEVLGSGDAAKAFQRFALRLPPLTHLSAATPSGAESTLELRVDDLLWREAASLAALGANDRGYVTRVEPAGGTSAIGGDGQRGQRLPSGRNNVTARYRQGIGPGGNVRAKQIALLASRPLGVKDVVNPLAASGGAGPDRAEAIRRNAPLAIMALDRLVSLADYADFARAFGGIAKAVARNGAHGVEVAIAGVEDAPIDPSSDVFNNLLAALRRFGDPLTRVSLIPRERLVLLVSASVRITPERRWEAVEKKLRETLLATFSFDRAELGAPLFLARATAAMQAVAGVEAVDIDVFDAIGATKLDAVLRAGLLKFQAGTAANLLDVARARIALDPHQLAWLAPEVRDTLILTEAPR